MNLSAREVPLNYSYLWLSKTPVNTLSIIERTESLINDREYYFLFNTEIARNYKDNYETYHNYLGPSNSSIYYEFVRQRNLSAGLLLVSSYSHVEEGAPGFGMLGSELLTGVKMKINNISSSIGWMFRLTGDDLLYASADVFGFEAAGAVNIKFDTGYARFQKLFKIWILGSVGPRIEYYTYLDTAKAGVVWDGLTLVDILSLSAEGMVDVYNRGLGGGMSHVKAEAEVDVAKSLGSDKSIVLKIGGTYSEDMFYEGLWGGLFELGLFDTAFISISYNYRDMLIKNPVKEAMLLGFRLNLNAADVKADKTIKKSSIIKDKTGKQYSVESFLHDENMRSKELMNIARKQEITAIASITTAIIAGAAVYFFDTADNNGIHAIHGGIAGGLTAMWISSFTFDLLD